MYEYLLVESFITFQSRWQKQAKEKMKSMKQSSSPKRKDRSPIALGLGIFALGLLCITVAVAGSASALSVDEVQSYSWANASGATDNALNHLWEEIPHTVTAPSEDQRSIPAKGLVLVGAQYSDTTTASQIRFKYLDADDDDNTRVDKPQEAEFVYDIDGTPSRDDRVHLASNVTYSISTDSGEDTGEGCGDTAPDLEAGTGGDLCWFLIELTPESDTQHNGRNHLGKEGLDTGTSYNLEVEVIADGASDFKREELDGGSLLELSAIEPDVILTDAEFIAPNAPSVIETNRLVTFNLTLETGNASESRSSPSSARGDVDVWLCLHRDAVRDRPYLHFDSFKSSSTRWDETPACGFYDVPTQGPRGDGGQEEFQVYGEAHTFAVNVSRTDQDRTGTGADDTRFYEYKFQIDEVLQTDANENNWFDEFVFRVITRDAYGNIEYHTLDDDYTSEDDGSSIGPGVFRVAEFDLRRGLQATEDDLVSTFKSQGGEGCFQPDTDTNKVHDISDNGEPEDEQCYRSLDLLPPYDDIEIPFIVRNHGNADDTVELSVSDPSQPGNLEWDVHPLAPDGSGSGSTVTYDIDKASSPGSSTQSAPSVVFSLPDDAVAPDERIVKVEIESDQATNPTPSQIFFRANLIPNPRGELTLGSDFDEESRVDVMPDGTSSVDLTYNNTGNTNGDFDLQVQDSSNRCLGFNSGKIDDKITLDLRHEGIKQNNFSISPGGDRDLRVDVNVGRDVPIGEYECDLSVEDRSEDPPVDVILNPIDPTIIVEVVGETSIEIFRTTSDADRDEESLTGQRLSEFADPTAGSHEVVLYLENTGDAPLAPELETGSSAFKLADDRSLDATWWGQEVGNLTIEEAAESFTLPVSDQDDLGHVEISDIFDEDGNVDQEDELATDGHWTCGGIDTGADSDEDPRALCRVEFHLDYENDDAIIGDRVVYDFEWDDSSDAGDPSNTTVELDFGYPGEVVTDSVSDRAIGTNGQTSRLVFEGRLDEGHSFDTDQDSIDATVEVGFRNDACGASLDDTKTQQITSSSLTATTARFPVDIRFEDGANCVSFDGDKTWTFNSAGEIVEIEVAVEDEEGAMLRQIKPAAIRSTGASTSTSQPSSPRSFDIHPSIEMATNGSQFARVTFDDRGTWTQDSQVDPSDEGLLLSRANAGEDISSYTTCDLDENAVTTSSEDRIWTRIAPAPTDTAPIDDNTGAVLANENIHGLVMRENNDQAVPVGQIALYGWGSGSEIDWNEGWNPIMLRLVDSTGDPAQPPTASNAPDIDLTLKFAIRNQTIPSGYETGENAGGPLMHTFELSSEDGAIPIEPLGQGYYRADVYLPTGIRNGSGFDSDLKIDGDPLLLSDHPMDDSANVEYEAWALHADVNSGESTARQDVSGDAYWRADQLGLLSDDLDAEGHPADPYNGTVGNVQIGSGGNTVSQFQTNIEAAEDRHEDTRQYVHASVRFLGGPIGPGDNWVTGPGAHNVDVFLLEETDDGQRGHASIGDNRSSRPFHEHTFQPVRDASGTMVAENQARSSVNRAITINSVADTTGLYRGLLNLPDTGDRNSWFAVASMKDGSGNSVTPTKSDLPFIEFDVEPTREAASNGIPMPLCVAPPSGGDLGEGDPDGTAGDFDFDTRREEVTLDLRSIPGLRPDRLEFTFTPILESGDGGVRMLNDDDDLYAGSTFTIKAPGLVTMDDSLLPGETESGRDLRVRVPVDNPAAVGGLETWLEDSGGTPLTDPVELTDPDGDDTYTGDLPISTSDEGNRTLVVEATDTSGGVTAISQSISVVPNTAPQISVISPTGDTLAIPSDGSITFAVDDGTVASLSQSQLQDEITIERSTTETDAGSVDTDGEELSTDDINVTGIDSIELNGATETITVNITEDGDPAEGTVYVNVSGEEQFNASLVDGEADGDVSFPDDAQNVELTVELNGANRPSGSFDIELKDAQTQGSFSEVGDDQLEWTFDDTTVEVAYFPDVGSDTSEVTARLTANLTGEPEVSRDVTVEIDNEEPTLSIEIDDESPGTGTTIVGPSSIVSASASDDLTGVASLSIEAFRDDESTGSVSVSSGSVQATMEELGIDEEGTASVLVVVEDAAGNEERENITVDVDATGPTISQPEVEVAGSSLLVTVDATDDNGVSSVRLFAKTPDETNFNDEQMTLTDDGSYEAQISDPGSSGLLEYFVRATDEVGNRNSEGSRNTPLTFSLDDVEFENEVPSVDITSPSDGATVSGTVDVEFSVDDVESSEVTLASVVVEHAEGTYEAEADLIGSALDVPADPTVSVDTTQLANGPATLTVTVDDGEATAEASIALEIDNPTAGDCDETVDLDEEDEFTLDDAEDATVCVQVDPMADATGVRLEITQDGTEILSDEREVAEDGVYPLPQLAPGDYDVTLTQVEETEDGSERELSTSSASLSLAPPKPFARFITTLVLGVSVLAAASYAALGRWS